VPVAEYGNAGGRGEESVIADEAEGAGWVLKGWAVCAASSPSSQQQLRRDRHVRHFVGVRVGRYVARPTRVPRLSGASPAMQQLGLTLFILKYLLILTFISTFITHLI
jgi:hypothetical protein